MCNWDLDAPELAALILRESSPEGTPIADEPPAVSRLAVDLGRRLIVFECDYRGPRSSCGCTDLRVCGLGKGRGPGGGPGHDVAMADCLACVAAPTIAP